MSALLVAVLSPFAGAALLPILAGPRAKRAGWIASGFIGASFALICLRAPSILQEPLQLSLGWAREIGFSFSILADGLSLLFALLITGIGLIVFTFAAVYLDETERIRRFFCYLLIFAGAMLGVVLSANLVSLYVFWELTSVSSFLLIGFWHEREASRNGALKALVITVTGGLAMLVGFIMVGIIAGSFEIPTIIANRHLLTESPWATTAALLIIAGAMTKSAQLPFHLWLPSAMEAPTPVSAYLHAATMVKAGLYLVARLGPAMHEIPVWSPLLATVGIATMAWCSFLALRQKDLKALLAFSTVSQLGLIMSLLAWNRPDATSAGLFHILNHGLFKGALFLLVGVIEHAAHTRDLTRLPSLRRYMPRTYILLAVAALSMAGIPPLGGFVSKEMFLDQALGLPALLPQIALIGAALTVAYSMGLALGLGEGRSDEAGSIHEASAGLLWGPAVLVAGAVVLGLMPQGLAGHLVEAATGAALASHPPHLHLALWHGFNITLAASVAAIAGGLVIFAAWWRQRDPDAPTLVADRAYTGWLAGLERYSRAATDSYMSGVVSRYATIIVGVTVAGCIAALSTGVITYSGSWPSRTPGAYEYAASLVPMIAAIAAVRATTRLAAIIALGASGYSLALLFALLGAPDLALTQVMVETISVALFLAAFVFLPPYYSSARRTVLRPWSLGLAVTFGFGAAYLVYQARAARVATSISGYFVENSVEQAGGHNIVNVILVDFRGLDTLGEISVLGIAALACFALIALKPERRS